MANQLVLGFEPDYTPELLETMTPEELDTGITIMPESPVTIEKDAQGNVVSATYGDLEKFGNGMPCIVWFETINRDATGKISSISTIRGDWVETEEVFNYDAQGQLMSTTLLFK